MRRTLAALLLVVIGHAPAATLDVQISIGSIEHPQLPLAVREVQAHCALQSTHAELVCRDGTAQARVEGQAVRADLAARLERHGAWDASTSIHARDLTLADKSGRLASEKLDLDLSATLRSKGAALDAEVNGDLLGGQLYVEPVFVDFANAAARLDARLSLDRGSGELAVNDLHFEQAGVASGSAQIRLVPGTPPDASLDFSQLQLGPAFATYAQPFLAGTSLEKLTLGGTARSQVAVQAGVARRIDLHLEQASFEAEALAIGLRGLDGAMHWTDAPGAENSALSWSGGHVARLELGPSELKFHSAARDGELLAPLRLPLAGGALRVNQLQVKRAGQPDMDARFDAEIEPIDLAALCRAFGWPEFGGSLGGRLPGLSFKDRELKLDGALTAHAFDGDITVNGLSVLDPFGRVPRVEGTIGLRKLDLAALTGAFSFGRIEGRLDGEVRNLRLLNWLPVSFQARLETTPGDGSRHRISQRAIDNISSIGGGPSGVLSRGALSVFKNFSYDRIGWSCVLSNGVCRMDGVEPAPNGGYVLVKGRWLPRIDVVGFNRTVDWTTFVQQIQDVRRGGGAQLR